MKIITCAKCGSNDFFEQDGFRVCKYCLSKYLIQDEDRRPYETTISIDKDIKGLLKKCKDDPRHARRYASLVLDIDPNNADAKKFLL